jgi:hypothetical protein
MDRFGGRRKGNGAPLRQFAVEMGGPAPSAPPNGVDLLAGRRRA